MAGKKKAKACKHRQGFWHKKYDIVYLKCRGCKSTIELKVGLEWPKDAAGAAAQLDKEQTLLPQPAAKPWPHAIRGDLW